MTTTTKIIVGTRPTGSCKPDGSTVWVTREFIDGRYKITKFNGWLIDEETTTTDPALVQVIEAHYLAALER